jgi:hypothetical protein
MEESEIQEWFVGADTLGGTHDEVDEMIQWTPGQRQYPVFEAAAGFIFE